MVNKNKRYFVFFFMFSFMLFTPNVSRVLGELEAALRVSEAEDSLEAAFLSVLEAERAGGDVTEIVDLLNNALVHYSEAERALEYGEYDTAVQLARKAIEDSNLVLETTMNLILVVGDVKEKAFRNQLFLSFGMVCLIVLFGILGWRQFKLYYVHRVMDFKPEVIVDEP